MAKAKIKIDPASVWLQKKAHGILRAACAIRDAAKSHALSDAFLGRKLGPVIEEASKIFTLAAATVAEEEADRRWTPKVSQALWRNAKAVDYILEQVAAPGFDWNTEIKIEREGEEVVEEVLPSSIEEAIATAAIARTLGLLDGGEDRDEAIKAGIRAAAPAVPPTGQTVYGSLIDPEELAEDAITAFEEARSDGSPPVEAKVKAITKAVAKTRKVARPTDKE